MPAPFGSNDIQNLRTYAMDSLYVRSGKAVQPAQPFHPETPEAAPVIAQVLQKELSEITPKPSIKQEVDPNAVSFDEPEFTQQELSPKVEKVKPPRPVVPQPPVIKQPSKELETIRREATHISTTHKESILSEDDEGFEVNPTRSGSIIRDTKRKRFRLVPAMGIALAGWWTAQKKTYDALMHPHHAVTKAEARKDVIEEAVRSGTQAPKEDFKSVAQRMKHKKRTAVSSTLTFKEKTEVPEPAWTYVQNDGETSLVDLQEQSPGEIVQPVQSVADSEALIQELIIPEEPADAPPLPPSAEKIETVSEPDARISLLQDEATPELQQASPVEEPTVAEPDPARTRQKARSNVSTAIALPPAPRMGTIFIVMAVAILSGVAFSYYLFGNKEVPQEPAVVYKIPALLQAEQQEAFPLPDDRQALLEQLRMRSGASQATVQMYPTRVENGIERPATATEILDTLSPRAPGSFSRSVREMTFGATRTHEPFIILSVGSFDTAFAGMLAWETTMSGDLSPLFGETVVETFDPSARTDTQVRNAFFKDTIASNKNVRLLLDEKGDDRIVYTFTNQGTILITTTRAALEELLPLVH